MHARDGCPYSQLNPFETKIYNWRYENVKELDIQRISNVGVSSDLPATAIDDCLRKHELARNLKSIATTLERENAIHKAGVYP